MCIFSVSFKKTVSKLNMLSGGNYNVKWVLFKVHSLFRNLKFKILVFFNFLLQRLKVGVDSDYSICFLFCIISSPSKDDDFV